MTVTIICQKCASKNVRMYNNKRYYYQCIDCKENFSVELNYFPIIREKIIKGEEIIID